MDIIKSKELTEEQVRQIRELELVCRERDALENRLFLSTEINYDREIPTFFLACEAGELIGFLTVFIPTREEAEITAVVHPAHRRQGVFTCLDRAARQVIADNGIGRILYSVETKSKSAGPVLARLGISRIQRSEYRMKRDVGREKRPGTAPEDGAAFTVRRVVLENIDVYRALSSRVYGEEGPGYAEAIMSSDDRMGYVFYRNETPIGVFAIGLETKDEPFLYEVVIAEEERGKGYGRRLVEQACEIGSAYGRSLYLDVDSENPVALHLYKSLGFVITFQVDYYVR